MHKLQFTIFFLSIFFGFVSCSDDDNDGPSFDFKDQNLQGSINGQTFVLGDATVSRSNNQLSIDLFDVNETESGCDIGFFGEEINAFFTIDDSIGVVELSFDWNSLDGQTVTLFDPEEVLNIILIDGAIEITAITETSVSGRIDARYDDDFINGNFTASFCD